MARLNHLVGNRIEPTVNLGELQRTQGNRSIGQRRVRQQEAREADWAVVIVIGQARRLLRYGLLCWPGEAGAHDTGAVEPGKGEIMLVDMRK